VIEEITAIGASRRYRAFDDARHDGCGHDHDAVDQLDLALHHFMHPKLALQCGVPNAKQLAYCFV
jgi:hypothetical protein